MIISNGPVITNDPANPFVADGAVVVQGDSIVAVGPAAQIRTAYPGEDVVDVGGRVIMSGLINAHTHAYSAYARGMESTSRPATSPRSSRTSGGGWTGCSPWRTWN